MTYRTITPQYFHEIYRDAAASSKTSQSDVWQDVFAVDQYGNLRPKHSVFSAIAAVPFYALFGNVGFWIMQQLFFLGLLFSTYLIVKQSTNRTLPWSTLLATLLLTQSLFHCYSFSYDLHGCTLLIGGLCILKHFPMIGAAVMTLSIFVRPSFLLLVLPLALESMWGGERQKRARVVVGGAIIMLLFGAYNYYMWGSPLTTAYSRLPGFRDGAMILPPHPFGFDLQVFLSQWTDKLFSSTGLLPYNLSILALPLVVASLYRERDFFRWVCLLSATGYSMYIFSYPMWDNTFHGNRFLLPAIYLYLLCFIPLIGKVETRHLSPMRSQERDALPET